MREGILRFRFDNVNSAHIAYDTMRELGYQSVMETGDQTFHIHVNRQDLTSALEIAASQGGELVEEPDIRAHEMIDDAYEMDLIPIPAHVVNEDWVNDDLYVRPDIAHDELSQRDEEASGWNDEDTTNHFPSGIHV